MTGNDPRYAPTASLAKGKSPTSWHFELSSRLMTSVVCVAEFLGRPVETNIVVTAKKGRENEIFKNVHNSHQYVAVGLNKKSGSSND